MPHARFLRLALVLPLSFAPLLACGGEDDDTTTTTEEQQPAREGPFGCYIEADRRCDCDLEEAACTEDVGIWTDGCATCAT